LTDAGKTFLTEARAVLQHADDAVKKARLAAAGTQGEIHVGYAPSLTVQILPRALRIFQAEFPKARVALHDLSTEEMLSQLSGGKLQVALMIRPTRKMLRGLYFEELARYPICVAVEPKHPRAKSKNISLEWIAREPLIAYSRKEYPEYHEMLEKLFAPAGHQPRIVEEHDGVNSIIAAVESGRGFALVPGCVACMVGPRLKLVPLIPPGQPVVVGAARCDKAVPALVEKFIAAARPETRKP
jgi:DNA-binding transcriptional LysR family regulator